MLLRIYRLGQWVATIVMMLLVTMTVADVILRWVFNRPIYGANEIANMMLTLVVGAGLLVTTSRRSHIRVDLLEGLLISKLGSFYHQATRFFEAVGTLLFSAIVALYAYEAFEYDEITVVLEWPVWPVFSLAAIFSAFSFFFIFKAIPEEELK